MKLIRINKYILNFIFDQLNYNYKLNIMRYNKQIQTKLEISLYTYQKKYFEIIITPALLNNSEILLQNNIFDKNTLDKLKLDWESDTKEIIHKKECFHLNEESNKINLKDNKILNISFTDENLPKKISPNLIELNLSNMEDLELPCSILLNLESLSLIDIYKIKFLSIEENISLNKLKHLYLKNISFNKKNKIKINVNNLKYLDLRIKETYSNDEDYDTGFNKEKTLENLVTIFDFQFLKIFNIDTNIFGIQENKYEEDIFDKYKKFKNNFKRPRELFDKKYLEKYDYFNFKILYKYYLISGSAELEEGFKYKYLFAKTKGNKYLFKTKYTYFEYYNEECYKAIIKETRYCNEINYDNYYFINNEVEIRGNTFRTGILDYQKINCLNIDTKYDKDSSLLLNIFEIFKENENRLEIISIEILDLDIIKIESLLINLKKFKNLKCFYITNDITNECEFQDNNLCIALLSDLSKINSLFLIEITIKGELELSKNDENKIYEISPDISIKKGKNDSHIIWYNRNYELKIKNKNAHYLIGNQMEIDEKI